MTLLIAAYLSDLDYEQSLPQVQIYENWIFSLNLSVKILVF